MIGAVLGLMLAMGSLFESGGEKLLPESHVPVLCPKDNEDPLKPDALGCDGSDGKGFQFNI